MDFQSSLLIIRVKELIFYDRLTSFTQLKSSVLLILRPHCSQSAHFQRSLLTGTLMKTIFLYFIILSLMRKQLLQRFLPLFWLKHILLHVSDFPKTQTLLLTQKVINNVNHICSFLLFFSLCISIVSLKDLTI